MTILVDESGHTVGAHGSPSDAVHAGFDLAVAGQPTVIILPSGRCWWFEKSRLGLWTLGGSDLA